MNTALPFLRLIGRQTLINRGKIKLLHMLAAPEKLHSQRFTCDFFGLRYSGDVANWVDWNVYFNGAYEPEFLQLLTDCAEMLRLHGRSVHYVDVGANVGHHALFMSTQADHVTAFEPFPRVADEIERKIVENSLENVRLFRFALGDEPAELEMRLPNEANLGTANLGSIGAPIGNVQVKVGDEVFQTDQLPRIDILKVDVEGFESRVFRGLKERILGDRPVIIAEIFGPDRSGFGSAENFRAALYPDHTLYSLIARGRSYELQPFSMNSMEVVCIPNELALHAQGASDRQRVRPAIGLARK